jgi:hypothetical protein
MQKSPPPEESGGTDPRKKMQNVQKAPCALRMYLKDYTIFFLCVKGEGLQI